MNRVLAAGILAAALCSPASPGVVRAKATPPATADAAGSTRPAASRPATAAELTALRDEARVLKEWADGMDGQYGGVHPAVVVTRDRQKVVEAAAAAGRRPAQPVLPPAPADGLARKEMEDEILVFDQWLGGMEQGYGKDHPAVAFVRDRVTHIERLLAEPAR